MKISLIIKALNVTEAVITAMPNSLFNRLVAEYDIDVPLPQELRSLIEALEDIQGKDGDESYE